MSRTLKGAIKTHARRTTDVEFATYLAHLDDGDAMVVRRGCHGHEPIRVASNGRVFPVGSEVMLGQQQGSTQKAIISAPPPGRSGLHRFPVNDLGSGVWDGIILVSADPDEVEPGFSGAVEVTGGPFRESPLDAFEAVVPSGEGSSPWAPDSHVSISAVQWDTADQVTLTISVSEDKPAGSRIWFRARRS